jgi:hypothetical protein
MENLIKKARQEIVGEASETEIPVSPLTQCAVDIATVALTAFTGALREKALDVARAIADYEDTLKALGP